VILDPVAFADAFVLAGCPVCRVLPALEAELVDGFAAATSRSLTPGGASWRSGLYARHWWLVASVERDRWGAMSGTAGLLADVLDRSPRTGRWRAARCA
jgi:hypothetical protein